MPGLADAANTCWSSSILRRQMIAGQVAPSSDDLKEPGAWLRGIESVLPGPCHWIDLSKATFIVSYFRILLSQK